MKNIVPIQMHIGISALGVVVGPRIDNEPIVRVNVSEDVSERYAVGVQSVERTSPCHSRGNPSPDPMSAASVCCGRSC